MTKDVVVKVAKETDDVMVLLAKLAVTVRQKGDYADLVSDLLRAIDGVAEVPAEASNELWSVLNSVALRGVEIAQALVSPKA